MALNTDTISVDTRTTTGEATGPVKGRPPTKARRRLTLMWAAVIAACIAVAAIAVATLWADDDSTDSRAPAHAGIVEHGSIRSIEGSVEGETGNRAALKAEAERYVEWLESRAEQGPTLPAAAGNRAALKAEAERYVEWLESRAEQGATLPAAAGNRAALKAEAERYVEWLESRAEQAATPRAAAEGERVEWTAHLEGQARTYG